MHKEPQGPSNLAILVLKTNYPLHQRRQNSCPSADVAVEFGLKTSTPSAYRGSVRASESAGMASIFTNKNRSLSCLGHCRIIIGNTFTSESIEEQGSSGITEYINRSAAHIHETIHPGNNRDSFHRKVYRRQDDS